LNFFLVSITSPFEGGGEFAEISPYINEHVRTSRYHPEAIGEIER
jgi:hypothetical protein